MNESNERIGRLALADGTVFRGRAFGAEGVTSVAEVVFNTAMAGYQESLTDPSYTGQILVATFPLIGNTGVNPEDVESSRVRVAGFVVRELARRHSNYRATSDLDAYLREAGVLGLTGVNTRAITRRLRFEGAMAGVLTDDPALSTEELVEMARGAPSMQGRNLVPEVGCSANVSWSEDLGAWGLTPVGEAADRPRLRVLALDCGAKQNILRHLVDRGCEVTLVPHTVDAAEVRRLYEAGEVDGVFISNGPGDPAAVERTVGVLRTLMGEGKANGGGGVPMFGICLGHQLLALAAGAKTYKLKFGHRGANQPVRDMDTGRVEITSQNHGFAVDAASLEAAGGEVTHLHLNDGTVAGFRLRGRPVMAVQHHPEASPGPHDAAGLFDRFVELMLAGRKGVTEGAGAASGTSENRS